MDAPQHSLPTASILSLDPIKASLATTTTTASKRSLQAVETHNANQFDPQKKLNRQRKGLPQALFK
jgi:hypothetical protein